MLPIQLYNTLSRKKEPFQPLKKNRLSFYSCGPTVYNFAHIGNLRTYILNDLIKRTFIFNSYQVKHIMNITDVGHLVSDADEGEDKMEKARKREGKSAWDIAKFYTTAFKKDCQNLNILPPTKYVPATSCITEQLKLVKLLWQQGYLYKTTDGLYFDSTKIEHYGELAKLDIANLKAGARIKRSTEIKNVTDFAVWKFSPKDQKREMEWPSAWGTGFPGWHLECSAISAKHLGQPFDLHTGGIEHIPVHHVNEIAQSEAAYHKPLARYWVHFNHLNLPNGKMSKSAGNFITLESLQEKNIDPLAFRYFILQGHYGKKVIFSWAALTAAETGYHNLLTKFALLGSARGKINQQYLNKFFTAINNDFNFSTGLAILWDLLKDQTLNAGEKRITALKLDQVLGLNLGKKIKKNIIPATIKKMAEQRWLAKKNKNYELADQLRLQIEQAGFEIEDQNNDYTINKKHPT